MNLCIFIGYSNQIPIFLGLFGKENLVYESKFDASDFDSNPKQFYFHKSLNTKFVFYRTESDYLNESDSFFSAFEKVIVIIENIKAFHTIKRTNELINCKKMFIWHYAEVFEKGFINSIENIKYDLIYSGSKRPELEINDNFILDFELPFRYFRYYIGYVWLEGLLKNIEIPKYNKNVSKLFSYVRAHANSSWRTDFIKEINGLELLLSKKDSANDAYDLLYPKYKHFEAINDYLYCNFNLVFETLNPANTTECFITEKTFKGLFFGKPFLLVTSEVILNYLKNRGYHLLNFEFKETITSYQDVKQSIKNFTDWIQSATEDEIEKKYNEFLNKSINNRKILFEYLNDYSQSEKIFTKLLNE